MSAMPTPAPVRVAAVPDDALMIVRTSLSGTLVVPLAAPIQSPDQYRPCALDSGGM
jgi:hypothetical protein